MDINYSTYDGSSAYFLEKYWNTSDYLNWMNDHWTVSIWIGIVYILLVFWGKSHMQEKQPYDLRKSLFIWNVFLALFSLLGTIRTLPELVYSLRNNGFEYSVCSNTFYLGHSGIWGSLFVLSKVVELIDTLFIVLRKQPLIFLHWYHHFFTLWVSWHSCYTRMGVGRWYAVMNFAVHSMMYSYYAFRSMKFKIPRFVNIVITSCQIMQMIVGIYVTYSAYVLHNSGVDCHANNENLIVSLLMYISYFFLFAKYFYKAYIQPKSKASLSSKQNGVNSYDNGVVGHQYQNGKKD